MREVEAKLRVSESFVLPDLAAEASGVSAVSEPSHAQLRADYFDTPDLRLARNGVTLRRRVGGGDDGWHLKLPEPPTNASSGAVARDELQLPLLATDEVPERFHELVTAWARRSPLGQVATLVTDRTTYLLQAEGGETLAELTDDTVSVVDGEQETSRFREVEVEDRGGGDTLLGAVATALVAHGAVAGEFVPKVVRALGAAAGAEPDVPEPDEVRPEEPAALAVTATLRRHIRSLLLHDAGVRRHQDDAVHQMRVSARRLRSALRTFRPLLDAEWAGDLRAELGWLGSALGEARDAEVLEMRLLAALEALPEEVVVGDARKIIVSTLGGRVAAGQTAALETLRSDRYLDLLDRLVEAAQVPCTSPDAQRKCRTALPPLVLAAWKRLDRRAAQACLPGSSDAQLHATRIAAKRARYTTEAVAPVFGKPADKLAKRAEEIQEILGEQHDAVVAAATVIELSGQPRVGRAGFTFGVLHERQLSAAAAARAHFQATWPEARRRRHRAWLED